LCTITPVSNTVLYTIYIIIRLLVGEIFKTVKELLVIRANMNNQLRNIVVIRPFVRCKRTMYGEHILPVLYFHPPAVILEEQLEDAIK
jgi:hypothetical protein